MFELPGFRQGGLFPSMTPTPVEAHDWALRQRLVFAASLFVLSPLVGEWLFGNQAITELPAVILLAPLYGGGALLVREAARRSGRGWPTMLLLAAAYALLEEGPIDQMLWNPHYGGFDMGAAYASTYVPVLGTSVEQLQDVLTLHTVWSICVPIAIIEAFDRGPTRPWLGNIGLWSVGLVFAIGSVFLALAQAYSEDFVASPTEFATATVAIVILVVLAFRVPRLGSGIDAHVPRPWLVGAVAFGASSLYFSRDHLFAWAPAWVVAGGRFALTVGVVAVCLRWSRSRAWTDEHRLALAGGALLTYMWVGFDQSRYLEVTRATALLGNVVFGTSAILLLGAATRSLCQRLSQQKALGSTDPARVSRPWGSP